MYDTLITSLKRQVINNIIEHMMVVGVADSGTAGTARTSTVAGNIIDDVPQGVFFTNNVYGTIGGTPSAGATFATRRP